MDIAALSMELSSAKTMQGVEISMTKKAMDLQETMAQSLIQDMMPTPQPSFNHKLDMYV